MPGDGAAPRDHAGYRADIDGLRAIAVLAVVLFHAFPAWLPGGFVGVDVFFVISGFLITGILVADHDAGRFSFAAFYARRARRIFPALVLVLVTITALGALLLSNPEFAGLGRHVVGGALFSSNFVLWREAGYFDAASTSKPLLHLWSLGIEEQFYLVWPMVMLALARSRRHRVMVTTAIALASFTLGVVTVGRDPGAAFYSPATRAWELMAGALLAVAPARAALLATPRARNVFSLAGALLLAVAIGTFSPATTFPGWNALLPVVGAALLVGAGADGWLNRRLLNSRALVGIGLVSYPLYLWHWPLLVLARSPLGLLHAAAPLPPLVAAAVVAISMAAAWLTWRLLEMPLKRPALFPVALRVTFALGAVAALGGIVSVSQTALDHDTQLAVDARRDWATPKSPDAIYYASKTRNDPAVVFLGDSHAEQYYPAVQAELARRGSPLTVAFSTHGGCVPLPGYLPASCAEAYARSLRLAASPSVQRVVIAAAWERYAVSEYPGETTRLDTATMRGDFARLGADLQHLRALGKDIVLVRPHPYTEAADPELLAAYRRVGTFGTSTPTTFAESFPLDGFRRRTRFVDGLLSQLAARTGATLIDPATVLCSANRCITRDDRGIPVRKDVHHLRPFAAVRYLTYVPALLAPRATLVAKRR